MALTVLRARVWMLFVDGENFAKAGQRALKSAEVQLSEGPWWRRDVFLWPRGHNARWNAIEPQDYRQVYSRSAIDISLPTPGADLRRAYFYTSDVSDEPELTETRLAIRELGFQPRMFKRRQGRSKAVDVALASDVLLLGATKQYEAAAIVAGDGDYVPLIEAVQQLGLHVGVAFVLEDTSPELRIAADDFVDLTEALVKAWSPPGQPDEYGHT